MNYRHPCQAAILADPLRPYSLSAGAQMQLTDVGVCFWFCVWAAGGCEQVGSFVFVGGVILCFFCFFFILRRMGKNKALAHHTSTYFHAPVCVDLT